MHIILLLIFFRVSVIFKLSPSKKTLKPDNEMLLTEAGLSL